MNLISPTKNFDFDSMTNRILNLFNIHKRRIETIQAQSSFFYVPSSSHKIRLIKFPSSFKIRSTKYKKCNNQQKVKFRRIKFHQYKCFNIFNEHSSVFCATKLLTVRFFVVIKSLEKYQKTADVWMSDLHVLCVVLVNYQMINMNKFESYK